MIYNLALIYPSLYFSLPLSAGEQSCSPRLAIMRPIFLCRQPLHSAQLYFIWRRYWASPSKWLLTLYRHSLNWKRKEVEKLDESWINFLLIRMAKIFYLQHSSLALYIQLMRFQIHVKERHLNCYSVWRHGTGKKKKRGIPPNDRRAITGPVPFGEQGDAGKCNKPLPPVGLFEPLPLLILKVCCEIEGRRRRRGGWRGANVKSILLFSIMESQDFTFGYLLYTFNKEGEK